MWVIFFNFGSAGDTGSIFLVGPYANQKTPMIIKTANNIYDIGDVLLLLELLELFKLYLF